MKLYFNFGFEAHISSQGPPRSGSFPQIWGNDKFQNWGNSPDLGKWQIFDQFFVMEESIVTSYNYSGTCIIYWRIKIYICVPRQGTRKKLFKINIFFAVKFSPDLGKLPRFQENFKHFCFSPRSGEIP